MRVGSSDPGVIFIPMGIPRLVSMEPFEKPLLRSPQFMINRNRASTLQILLGLFFHQFTSKVGLMIDIIEQFQPKGKRWSGTKTDIKGKRWSGTSGSTMYWHLSPKQIQSSNDQMTKTFRI
jgi:hypothetical protein